MRNKCPNTRETAIEDIKKRVIVIKEDIEFKFKNDLLGFRAINGTASLSLNDYGRLCEIGYIVYCWSITVEEFENALKSVNVKFNVVHEE